MKPILLLLALSGLIAGGIYHEEVSRYFASVSGGTTQYGGSSSVVGSVNSMGSSGKSLMSGIGNALSQ